jgi:hypothetical protein
MLEQNYYRQGTFTKGSNLEWYTAKFNLFAVHVFNDAENRWRWEVTGDRTWKSQKTYSSKTVAYRTALNSVKAWLLREADKVDGELNENRNKY